MSRYLESDLVRDCMPLLKQAIAPAIPSLELHEQFQIGSSTPDIIGFYQLSSSSNASPGPLTANDSTVLASLRNSRSQIRIDRLEQQLGHENSTIRFSQIMDLERRKLIRRSAGGYISSRTRWVDTARLYAIEAKLERWQDALQQAKRFQLFADYSYTLLPESVSTRSTFTLDGFAQHNVGVLLYSNNAIRVAYRPKRNTEYTWRREFIISRLLSSDRD